MLTKGIDAGRRYIWYEVAVTLAPNRYRVDDDSLACGGDLRLLHKEGRFFDSGMN